MLKIHVNPFQLFDSESGIFTDVNGMNVVLVHSLVSVSKWESIYKRSFVSAPPVTQEETIAYIQAMITTQNVPNVIINQLYILHLRDINDYITDPMTATVITYYKRKKGPTKPITSEEIYYWLIEYSIPFSVERWHFNRLLKLLEIYNAKKHPEKLSQSEVLERNKKILEARKNVHNKG